MSKIVKALPGLESEHISISISKDLSQFDADWDRICGDSVYFKQKYLKLLEQSGPIAYNYYYVIIFKDKVPQGIMYCQRKTVKLAEDYRFHTHSTRWIDKLGVAITKFLFKFIKHEMLICGNVILTGEYGFYLSNDLKQNSSILVTKTLDEVAAYIKEQEGIKVRSIFLKDFYNGGPLKKFGFRSDVFTAFEVQPDMVFKVSENWATYADYLAEVKSKYRVKFKKVKKKGEALEYRTLGIAEAKQYNKAMYAMYKDTADRASYSMFLLGETYFSDLKETLGEEMSLTGVFLGEEMLAFYTYITNGPMGDAHFLGYNVKLNSKYQIYFNILLRLIEAAIINKVSYLNLSRTALEIKSSVGAEPHEMTVHLKYHIPWVNKWVPKLLNRFVPENKWVPRSPFK